MKKVFLIVGTRPDAIKMAPIILKFKETNKYKPIVIATGQHRQMLDQVLEIFKIKIDYDLNIMKKNQTLDDITINALSGLGKLMDKEKPSLVIVQGDTTTSFVGGLAAFYRKIPVAHVEAGLRTYDLYQPFPEEANRRLLDSISSLLFPPTEKAFENLIKEGIDKGKCIITGNTAIDSLLYIKNMDKQIDIPELQNIDLNNRKIILITAHRRENFGRPFMEFIEAIKTCANEYKDIIFIYPVHLNPNVDNPVRQHLSNFKNVLLLKPLDYFNFIKLMDLSTIILTDSGGVQEEAPVLGKPILVLRDVTERPEGVKAGASKIVGMHKEKIINELEKLLTDEDEFNKMAEVRYIYGDGKAAEKIYNKVEEFLDENSDA